MSTIKGERVIISCLKLDSASSAGGQCRESVREELAEEDCVYLACNLVSRFSETLPAMLTSPVAISVFRLCRNFLCHTPSLRQKYIRNGLFASCERKRRFSRRDREWRGSFDVVGQKSGMSFVTWIGEKFSHVVLEGSKFCICLTMWLRSAIFRDFNHGCTREWTRLFITPLRRNVAKCAAIILHAKRWREREGERQQERVLYALSIYYDI